MPDIDWIRKLCLALPDTTENIQWGDALCFKVRSKLFVVADISQGKLVPITLKSAPEKFNDLLEIEGISPAPYLGRYKWVRLDSSNGLRDEEIENLIRESYALVVAKAPKIAKTATAKTSNPKKSEKSARKKMPSKRRRAK